MIAREQTRLNLIETDGDVRPSNAHNSGRESRPEIAFLIDRGYRLEIDVTPYRINTNTISNRRWIAISQFAPFRSKGANSAAGAPLENGKPEVSVSQPVARTLRIRDLLGNAGGAQRDVLRFPCGVKRTLGVSVRGVAIL